MNGHPRRLAALPGLECLPTALIGSTLCLASIAIIEAFHLAFDRAWPALWTAVVIPPTTLAGSVIRAWRE